MQPRSKRHLASIARCMPLLLTLSAMGCGGPSSAPPPVSDARAVIYGTDDRRDAYQVRSRRVKRLLRAQVAIVPRASVHAEADGRARLDAKPWRQLEDICPDERFADQPVLADCSGVLVAADWVLTAGHCVEPIADASKLAVVFGYQVDAPDRDPTLVRKEDVYGVRHLVVYRRDQTFLDYTVLQLDRPVRDRAPVAIADPRHAPRVGDRVTMIGHPAGLPAKFAGNARVRQVDAASFNANLDGYSGNSGSPVFDERTGRLVGLMTDGEVDFVADRKRGCLRSKRCSDTGCRGETVARIDAILRDIQRRR